MIQKVCNGDDGKYVSYENACCCWRKADILPMKWNTDTNKKVGNATLWHTKKFIIDDLCNDLCNLMVQVEVKPHPLTDTSIVLAVSQS